MKKIIPIIVTAVILVGAGAFYGGMKYGENLSLQQGQRSFQANIGQGFQRNERTGANFLNGEVMAKDEQSLTLKMPDGGSKIVFFSNTTQISKMAEGSINDIEIGKQVMVNGSQNSDGSYTAQTIQLSANNFSFPRNNNQ